MSHYHNVNTRALENLIVNQLIDKFTLFMQPKVFLEFLQDSATETYLFPDESFITLTHYFIKSHL
jgi:hypothetical protein